jgi:Zn-dependent M28 family amino/carboxypeptidase
MTYYGRWTYKFEVAAERGAAAAFIVHETGPAGYPWEVVRGSWMGEQFDLVAADQNRGRAAVEGWIALESARALLAMAGQDFDALKQAAARRDFRPLSLGVRAKAELRNKLRTIDSANVAARISGREAPDELVIYCAHWDHFGRDPSRSGDNIFNGAKDNASGTAALFELAEAFQKLPQPPRRSVLFLAVTAEEQGLLGSQYYAANPLYPVERTVAVLNIDGLNVLGKTRDLTVVGMGQSTLDDLAAEVARKQGRSLRPDPEPEKGLYYRSDHFSFAKVGVPAFDPDDGVEFIGKPAGWGIEMRQRYTAEDYHKPSDEVKPYWDLAGAVDDLRLLYGMGYHLAVSGEWPEWKPGSEFRAIREAQKEKAR